MTEKKRTEGSLKKNTLNDSFENNVIRRPKIAKLKALFERSPTSDKTKTKSHTISRSHSLGPVRKPLLAEVTKPEAKPKGEPPIRSGGKLKVPKLVTPTVPARPVPNVKRSKSLKMLKDPNPLLTLLQFSSNDNLIDRQETPKEDAKNRKKSLAEKEKLEIQRKRSLESLIGSERLNPTWSGRIKPPPQSQPQPDPMKTKSLSLKHQFQLLSHASQKTMTSLANGLGIRERRNSFRQAVSKESSVDLVGAHFGSEGRFASVSEDSSVFVDASKPVLETLTVRTQNGEILRPKNPSAQKVNHVDERSRSYSHKVKRIFVIRTYVLQERMGGKIFLKKKPRSSDPKMGQLLFLKFFV